MLARECQTPYTQHLSSGFVVFHAQPNLALPSPAVRPKSSARSGFILSTQGGYKRGWEDLTHRKRSKRREKCIERLKGKLSPEFHSVKQNLEFRLTSLTVQWLKTDSPQVPRGGAGALPAMIAARSSSVGRGGPEDPSRHRRQSAASLAGHRSQRSSQENTRDGSHSHGRQVALLRARKALLIREMETNWYLKLCGRAKEDSVAFQTGMPYRWVLNVERGRYVKVGAIRCLYYVWLFMWLYIKTHLWYGDGSVFMLLSVLGGMRVTHERNEDIMAVKIRTCIT